MDIQAEKIELAKLLLDTNDPEIIRSIKRILQNEERDFWDDLSTDQKDEIQKASLELEEGKAVDYDSFMEKHRR